MTAAAPPPARRRRRWPYVVLGVLLGATAGVLACEAAGWPFLRGPLQRFAAERTGVPFVADGAFELRLLWNPGLKSGHLNVGIAPGFDAPHLLDAQDVQVNWRWRDVRAWRNGDGLRVENLQARTIDAHFLRHADGRASWQLGSRQPAPEKATRQPLPTFGRLHVDRGQIRVDDVPSRTALRVQVQGGEGGSERGYDATIAGTFRDLKLDLKAHAGGALPLLEDDAEGRRAPTLPLRVAGTAGASRVSFDGQAASLLRAQRLDGALQFSGPSLAAVGDPLGVTLPRTPAFDLAGRLVHDAGVWRLVAERANIGRSALAGDFRFDTTTTPRRLTGQLSGTRLRFADLGPAVGTRGEGTVGHVAPAKPGKAIPDRRFDLPSLRVMDADVRIAVDELDFGSASLAPFRPLKTHLVLDDGVLRLEGIEAGVAGGRVTGASRLDGSGEPARFGIDLRFAGVDIAGWIRGTRKGDAAAAAPPPTASGALKAERKTASLGGAQAAQSYITGELRGTVKLDGRGRSTAEILSTLDGAVHASLRDGTISHLAMEAAGLDVAQALGVLVRGDRPLPLRCAIVDMAVKNGVAQTQRAVLDNRDSVLRVDGTVDLRDESLALRARSRPKDVSPFTVRSPVIVTGTFTQPKLGLEPVPIAGRVLAAAALAAIAPPAAVLPFIDPGERSQGDPCVAGDAAAAPAPQAAASVPKGGRPRS
jgi:AsmA family protein